MTSQQKSSDIESFQTFQTSCAERSHSRARMMKYRRGTDALEHH